jgi:hypothetical protein
LGTLNGILVQGFAVGSLQADPKPLLEHMKLGLAERLLPPSA